MPHRVPTVLLVLMATCAAAAAQQPESAQPPDTMQARLLGCAACHGQHGEGTSNDYFPRLAGKPAQYLYNQLSAFHIGRRHYPPMNYLLEFQQDSYLRAMADYYAEQLPPAQAAPVSIADKAVLDRGQNLVAHGAPDRGIPPCSACHGPALTGMEPAIPGLLGLKPSYISAQLGAWRYGTRTAIEPDCMQIVAGHLTEADVTAVAAWLASQPVDPTARPLSQNSLHMPLRCGSEPQ